MKTILLWDARFPDRRPARLTVEDTVASAAVRAGVAAPANPADAGVLSTGGALDPGLLTEVVIQHGQGGATRRVFLPYSVVLVGASAGVLASIGKPTPGGVTPTPTPTPTLTLSSPSPSIASNAAAGTLVSNISNVPAGATPTVTPNDGRLVIAGDASAGWKVVAGMSALSAGTINFSVAATGATGAAGVLTVTAAGAGPTAFSYQPETASIMSASTAASSPVPTNRSRRMDRMVRRMKAIGAWDKFIGLYLVGATEANWKINLKSPGTYDLTVVGTPTYTPNVGASTAANTSYYETGIPLSAISRDSHSMGVHSRTNTSTAGADMGAVDANGNGLLITARNGTGYAQFRSFSGSNAAAIGAVGYWAGVNWCSFHRSASTGYRAARMGVPIATQATASVALASATPTIRILGAAGASTASVRTIAGAYVTNAALTDAQVSECEAAMQDYIDGVDYGEPYIEEKGIGPASVSADVVIFGTGIFAICAAVKAVRLGRTVKLMGDWLDETAWNLGGMPAAGLNLIDAKTFSRVSGIFRQIIRWANVEFYGRSTTTNDTASFSTEAGLSVEARGWNMGARRILDPSRQTGVLTGYDIPVYMSGGIASVQKTGTTITSVTGNDGRVFNCSQFIDASYEGDSIPLTGAPFTPGMEAAVAGTGEAGNGLQNILATLLLLKNDITGTTFKVDPYVTAGNAASGLLPDVELNPAGTRGQADPALQSMNFRLPVQTSLLRQAPLDAVPPRNYNPLRYEGLGRLAAAATAAGETLSEGSLYGNAPVGPGTLQDMNSGPGGFSTDCPGSGTRYMNAGANLAARRAVVDDNRDYQRGLYYWLRYSGDSRIPAARVTNMAALGLDALHFLDPCTGGSLWFPDRVYPREPIWQLKSDFVYNADDVRKAGGTAVRGSGKIATCVSYRDDKHDVRRVAFDDGAGMSIYRQGVVEGAVRSASVPLDVALPPTSVATNYQIIGAPSFTKMAWSAARMEFTLGLLGETAGTNAHVAIRDAVSVQATTYSNGSNGVRELMLTTTDAVTPVLPLTN